MLRKEQGKAAEHKILDWIDHEETRKREKRKEKEKEKEKQKNKLLIL